MESMSQSPSKRAGHPIRARKRNRLIYNDSEETQFSGRSANISNQMPRKSQRIATAVATAHSAQTTRGQTGVLDKKVAQRVGMR
jgi:hypothetical protein